MLIERACRAQEPSRARRVAGEILVVLLALTVDLVIWNGDRELRDGRLLPVWVVPVVLVASYGLLLLRWRRPLAVWTVCWLVSLAGVAIPRFQPFAGLLLALHAVASSRDRRTAGLAAVLCAVPFGVDTASSTAMSPRGPFLLNLLTFAVFWTIVTVVAWGFGRRSAVLRERAAAETARALREARLALARDLHNGVANKINAITMMAASLRLPDRPERETLERIAATGDRAIDELHRLLGLLRSVEDGAHPPPADRPGLADLDALVADVEAASDLTVVHTVLGEPRALDRSVDHIAHEVIAEALANAVKYGGARAVVDVAVHWTPERVLLVVRDSPRTPAERRWRPAARSSGHGLQGLRESVSLVGGSLEAGDGPDGFVVTADLPAARPALPAAVRQ